MASTASLMGIGAAMQAAGQGIDKAYQYKMAELRQKSLLELEEKRLDISERQLESMDEARKAQAEYQRGMLEETRAGREADQAYRREVLQDERWERFITRADANVARLLGKEGMTDFEEKLFLKLVEFDGDIESAKEQFEEQGLGGGVEKATWTKLKGVYDAIEADYNQYVGRHLPEEQRQSLPSLLRHIPSLAGLPRSKEAIKLDPLTRVPPLMDVPQRTIGEKLFGDFESEGLIPGTARKLDELMGYGEDPTERRMRVQLQQAQENARKWGLPVPQTIEEVEQGVGNPLGAPGPLGTSADNPNQFQTLDKAQRGSAGGW